jgi:fatty acid desaturase
MRLATVHAVDSAAVHVVDTTDDDRHRSAGLRAARRSQPRLRMMIYLPRFLLGLAVLLCVPALAPLAALAIFLLAFAITHDAAHGSLGLSRRATDVVLAAAGVANGTSGHALRVMHMKHHAHELAADDLEGAAAKLSFWRAIVAAPRLAVALHTTAWRTATPRDRRRQLVEYAALAALLVAAVLAAVAGSRPLAVYAAVAMTMQLFAPWWAGHIPHHGPWRALAARFAVLGSPTLASLAHHELHHRRPKLPTWRLHAAAIAEQ